MSTLRVDNIQDQGGAERRGLKTYAIICDQKTNSTDGGTFTSGAHRTRDLNTKLYDPDGIVSISSNQFTLGAGSYLIRASAPAFLVNRHVARLTNVTDSSTVQEGAAAYSGSSSSGVSTSSIVARVTITASKAFEIRHRCQTDCTVNGFGVSASGNATVSIYTIVEIIKEA